MGLAITAVYVVNEERPTWREEDDEIGSEIPSRTSKSAELINGDLRGQIGRGLHKGEGCLLI